MFDAKNQRSTEGVPDYRQGCSGMNAVHGAEPLFYDIISMRSEGPQEQPVWMFRATPLPVFPSAFSAYI